MNDPDFEIPELFIQKYNIFKSLDDENNLSWDTFASLFKESDFNGRFSNIFDVSNEFDKKFHNLNIESSDSSNESRTESVDDDSSDLEEESSDTDDEVIELFSSDGSN